MESRIDVIDGSDERSACGGRYERIDVIDGSDGEHRLAIEAYSVPAPTVPSLRCFACAVGATARGRVC